MANQTGPLADLRLKITALAALADNRSSPEAEKLVSDINQILDQLGGGASQGKPPASEARRTIGDARKCPRCSLRGFRAVRGETRPSPTGEGDEALFYCSSCGYEAWQDQH